MSLTIHCKYKYLDSTVLYSFDYTIQRAEDRLQKFYFCRLPQTSSLTSLTSILI